MAALDKKFELKLADKKVVMWAGKDGENASKRYEDCFQGTTVVAWRAPRYGLFIGLQPIIEPGDEGW